ncbi:urokinase plasminogen activator surface receptor-like isoform X2 [Myxocyprinus asiaticus]|uniref:urokinase plasminogen activator surface receptor-like isoform X2 n=1 Tax=Myxocyprinus asiaticus TaxID=70543 RepID=UPI0022228698|nr:urokinase plasminogen activator surface receptor-like isoform X2 [Myxocyprinus asiaticus]
MKTLLATLVLFVAVLHSEGLKCYTCVANNQEECNRQGSTVCPANSDACSTITGPHSVMKSCAYKSFCDKSHMSKGEMKLECCFNDDCNGPHQYHSHGEHPNIAMALSSSPVLLLGVLLIRVAVNSL